MWGKARKRKGNVKKKMYGGENGRPFILRDKKKGRDNRSYFKDQSGKDRS